MIVQPRRDPSAGALRPNVARLSALVAAILIVTPEATPAQSFFLDSVGVRELKEAVRLQNPDVLARRAALEAARARLQAVGFALPAVLSAEVEEIAGGIDVGSAGSIRLDVSRDFLSGSLRSAQRAVAERDVDRAQAELRLVERSLGAQVDRALTLSVGAIAIARRLAAEDSLLGSAEEGIRARFAVGEARYVDVLRLRTERLRIQTDVAAALTEARAGRLLLSGLIGWAAGGALDATADSVISRELGDPLSVPLPAAPPLDSLLALSSATLLGDIAVTRAKAARRLTGAEQRPIITASAGVQRFVGEDGGYSAGPTIGASISLPFTARRGSRAAIAAADHEVVATLAARDAAVAAVRTDMTTAYQRYESARERLALFDAALLRGARDERESALSAYRTGELSLLDLLDFERALARAEISRLRSRMDAVDALTDLLTGAAHGSDDERFTLSLEGDR